MCKYDISRMLLLYYSTDDGIKGHMVVGNNCRNDKLKEVPVHADNSKPVQLQPPPAAINETEANNTESMTLQANDTNELADINAPGETVINCPQVMPSDDKFPVIPLSELSYVRPPTPIPSMACYSDSTGKYNFIFLYNGHTHLSKCFTCFLHNKPFVLTYV